jgi:hypothetical protein
VPDAVVARSAVLSALQNTSGRTAEVPFRRDAVEAWQRRACLPKAVENEDWHRRWDAVLEKRQVQRPLSAPAINTRITFLVWMFRFLAQAASYWLG